MGGSGDRAFLVPIEGCQIISAQFGGAFSYIVAMVTNVVMKVATQRFKFGDIDASLGICEGDQGVANVLGDM